MPAVGGEGRRCPHQLAKRGLLKLLKWDSSILVCESIKMRVTLKSDTGLQSGEWHKIVTPDSGTR